MTQIKYLKYPEPKKLEGVPDDFQIDYTHWPEIHRASEYGKPPTAYYATPDDRRLLLPNPDEVYWIEKGFDYLEGEGSLREVTEWLEQKLHRTFSHQTIAALYDRHRRPFLEGRAPKRRKGRKQSMDTKKLIAAKNVAINAAKRAKAEELRIQKKKAAQAKKPVFDLPRDPNPAPKKFDSTKAFPESSPAMNVLFKPNPGPQEDFLRATEEEVLFGGAAGGKPKTWFNRLLFTAM